MNKITGDGRIDKQDVNELKKFLMDDNGHYAMDQKKADMLVLLKKWPSSKDKVDDGFSPLFKEAICSYLLQDNDTAGRLDTQEIDWLNINLIKQAEMDEDIDSLLDELKKKSINYPVKFDAVRVRYKLTQIVQDIFDNNDKPDMQVCVKTLSDLLEEYNRSIDRGCLGLLFEIKSLMKKKNVEINKEFQEVYLEYIKMVLLKDAKSPRRIDDDEAKWLESKLLDQPEIDDVDKALLDQLKERSMNFPEVLEKMHFEEWKKEILKKIKEKICVRRSIDSKDSEEDRSLEAFLDEKYVDYQLAEREKVKFLFELKNLAQKHNQVKEWISGNDYDWFIETLINKVANYLKHSTNGSMFVLDKSLIEWLDELFKETECLDNPYDIVILENLKNDNMLIFPTELDSRLSHLKIRKVIRDLRDIEVIKNRNLNFGYTKYEERDNKYQLPQKVDFGKGEDCVDYVKNALYNTDNRLKIDSREAAEYLTQIKELFFIPYKRYISPFKTWFKWTYKETYNKKFSELYVEVLTSFLLDDSKSRGEIDPEEVKWLLAKIKMKGGMDDYDVDLLDELKAKSINYPEKLINHVQCQKSFEWCLFHWRYLSLVAVVASMIGAIILFVKGSIHIVSPISRP